ncbi:MAG TPA: DsbA family protein [Thermomicrobiales bacterium]|nr:DsbA family protein [Thermomicrobiales bacterium]
MGQDRVDRLSREYDIDVEWRAFLLRPDTPPEGMPHPLPPNVRAQRSAPMREMAANAGLTIVDRDWISSSRLALEASEYARLRGAFEPFHRAVFHAYFAEGRDIGSIDVLAELGASVGLDPEAMIETVQRGDFAHLIDEDVLLSSDLGLTGVPAFILGNRAIVGAQPYDVFEQVMGMLGARKRTEEHGAT